MAKVHESLATDLLDASDPKGWIHLQAAATAFVKTGDRPDYDRALKLLTGGIERALVGPMRNRTIADQILDLLAWARAHDPTRDIAVEPAKASSDKRREVA